MSNNDFKTIVNVEELFLSMSFDKQNDFLIKMLKLRQKKEKIKIIGESFLKNEIQELFDYKE